MKNLMNLKTYVRIHKKLLPHSFDLSNISLIDSDSSLKPKFYSPRNSLTLLKNIFISILDVILVDSFKNN